MADENTPVDKFTRLLKGDVLPKFSELSDDNVNEAAVLLSALATKFNELKDVPEKVEITQDKLKTLNRSVFGLFTGADVTGGGRRRTRSARSGRRRAKSRRRRFY